MHPTPGTATSAPLTSPTAVPATADTGHASFAITFDFASGEVTSVTTTAEAGPHPILDSGGSLVCDVIVAALS